MLKIYFCIIIGLVFTASVMAQSSLDASPVNTGVINLSELQAVQPDPIGDKDEDGISSSSKREGDPDQPVIIGEVPNTESGGIEHEDIGIIKELSAPAAKTVHLILEGDTQGGTSGEIPGIDDDEFGFIANGQTYLRAGFIKLGDIKGDANDDSSSGKIEYNWKVEEGTKAGASKPKEIIVVGTKSNDKSSPSLTLATCKGEHLVCKAEDVFNDVDLKNYAQLIVGDPDTGINKARITDNSIELVSSHPFKLFGFIPLRIKQTTTINTSPESFGRVKVKFPWWAFFGKKPINPSNFTSELEQSISDLKVGAWSLAEYDDNGRLISRGDSAVDEEAGSIRFGDGETGAAGPAGEEITADESKAASENVTLNFAQIKAQLHDTAMAIIRNIK